VTDRPDPPFDPWARPLFTPGGADPFVYFVVFGADGDLLEIDGEVHQVDEIPDGIDAHELGAEWVRSFFDPPMGDQLRAGDPATAARAEACDSCIVVTGSVTDPPTLAYLRNSIGITTAALDTGGVGVLSLQTMTLFDPQRWREEIAVPGRTLPRRLVSILFSEQEPGTGAGTPGDLWVHTRGLRVYGRPDLSMHDVAAEALEATGTLFNALIVELAGGLVIHDGMRMGISDELGALDFAVRGDLEDPDFNNQHVEITWA
jgi:hypothetical protein